MSQKSRAGWTGTSLSLTENRTRTRESPDSTFQFSERSFPGAESVHVFAQLSPPVVDEKRLDFLQNTLHRLHTQSELAESETRWPATSLMTMFEEYGRENK